MASAQKKTLLLSLYINSFFFCEATRGIIDKNKNASEEVNLYICVCTVIGFSSIVAEKPSGRISNTMAKQPKNLLTATKEERQEFLDSFDYIFTDCDGKKQI